ncbi:hypothetical protein GGR51DRAFT_563561 [Nemania sp. FL0031]|nr:hypothetical protein GGR51DRAFT_563561 [Nemania sp. FL0031]
MSYADYIQAYKEDRVVHLKDICRDASQVTVTIIVNSVEYCKECVLYWPFVNPTSTHSGWCQAIFPDKPTAQRARQRLDHFRVNWKQIRALSPYGSPSKDMTSITYYQNRKRPAVDDGRETTKRASLLPSIETEGEADITPAAVAIPPSQSLVLRLKTRSSVLLRKSTDPAKEWKQYYVCNPTPESNYLLVSEDDMMDTVQVKIPPEDE